MRGFRPLRPPSPAPAPALPDGWPWPVPAPGETVVVPTSCSNNCGGRCVLRVHVRDGVIQRIESDADPDRPESPQLRACLRGRSYRHIVYHPDRLQYPLRRVGRRGEGRFERISWDEATTLVANQVRRITAAYGPLSLYVHYAWGTSGINRAPVWAARLLSLYGGDYLGYYGSYSSGQTSYATPLTYGTSVTGSHRSEWANSKLIILMGYNPAETVFGTNTLHYLRRAREAGARIICIDPRYTDTAVAVADEWIPLRPSTDSALLSAMAYVILSEGLQDQRFLDRYCLGFDEAHMPADVPPGNSFASYLLGRTDGVPKTPAWAAPITGVPAERIARLAREYATARPAALLQGYGPQRHANGEQSVRSVTALAVMTGNVGIPGGWASGQGLETPTVPLGSIPVPGGQTKISCFLWTDAILRGREMTARRDLIQGAERLPSNIKAIFNLGGNALVNQHSDINRTVRILADESLAEFIVASDLFMTPSTKYADLVLPAASQFERENIEEPWNWGDYAVYMNPVIRPPGECRDEYDWLSEVAEKLGIRERFTEGKSMTDWLRQCCEPIAAACPEWPGFDEFRRRGVFKAQPRETVAFAREIADPDTHPFPTPSGKIELFSRRLYDRAQRSTVPAVPAYVPCFDGPADPLAAKYPLQLIGWHYKRRVHTIHDNNPWMNEAARQELWINPLDAAARKIKGGETVRVFNDRGALLIPVRVTPRIMPGVVAIPQGAWARLRPDGTDTAGSINVLTTQRGSYMSNANPQHTNLVQVARVAPT